MNSKWSLISSIVQLVFGILSIIVFVVLAVQGEIMTKWIITLLLAIAFVIIGIIGIIAMYILFGYLTYKPIQHYLFFDTNESKYGINIYAK